MSLKRFSSVSASYFLFSQSIFVFRYMGCMQPSKMKNSCALVSLSNASMNLLKYYIIPVNGTGGTRSKVHVQSQYFTNLYNNHNMSTPYDPSGFSVDKRTFFLKFFLKIDIHNPWTVILHYIRKRCMNDNYVNNDFKK